MTASETAPETGNDLVISRHIAATPDKVYRAWTEAELLRQWFAPLPYTTPAAELDVRPGGANRIVMRSPEGQEIPCHGVYLEVVPNARLVFTDAYVRAWEPSAKPFMTVIVTLEADGSGRRTSRWDSTRDGVGAPISWRRWLPVFDVWSVH